jgi:hypothetical protein
MPAVPIIAAVTGAAGAIGAAAATAVGLGTVGAVAATAIGTGIIAGGMTAVQGGDAGDILKSAVVGGATSFVGGTVAGAVGGAVSEATGSTILGNAAGSAAGTLATGGGGDDVLASGLLGGIGAGIEEAKLAAAEEYLNSFPSGYGDYTDTPVDMSEFGFPPTETPMPPSAGYPEGAPTSIEGTLAALNLAKTVAPSAVTALMSKNAYDSATQDEQGNYSYPIVPAPAEWQPPQYNQQPFVPSEPIDFGSPELLQGTQWDRTAKPMQIDGLMNVLNNQYIQPQTAPQFGLDQIVGNVNNVPMSINDIIGNIGNYQTQPFDMNQNIGQINGSPASLASIIAGIQGQYGQETSS